MSEDVETRTDELREMVENHWRNLIRLAGVDPQMAAEEVFCFEATIEELTADLPPEQETWFRNALQRLRGEYAEWERTNPDALRKSLNVTGGGRGTATAWLANLETPPSVDLRSQQDAFWRELLVRGVPNQKAFQVQWTQFLANLQAQVSHLPQPEQDGIMTRVVLRNAQYIALAQRDREALKAQLGVSAPQATPSPFANAVVETAVRATIWQGIGALFRAFR
jgi:hypothetical protein